FTVWCRVSLVAAGLGALLLTNGSLGCGGSDDRSGVDVGSGDRRHADQGTPSDASTDDEVPSDGSPPDGSPPDGSPPDGSPPDGSPDSLPDRRLPDFGPPDSVPDSAADGLDSGVCGASGQACCAMPAPACNGMLVCLTTPSDPVGMCSNDPG